MFVNLKRIRRTGPAPQSTPKKKKLCSCKECFSWQTNCFYCDTPVIFDDRHEDRHHSSRRVQCRREYVELISKVRKRCNKRSDKAASLIKTRIGAATDLVAKEAVYHSTCAAKFFNDEPKRQTGRGRPSNTPSIKVLEKLYSYLESENELFTLADLHEKLKEFAGTDDVFVPKYIKQELMDRYGDQIFFAESIEE